jgi:hypothetical protein
MDLHNTPNIKKIVDIAANAEYLKIETDNLELGLKSSDTLSIQPKDTVFGLEISPESAKITFDTSKLKDQKKSINSKELLDSAIKDYFEQSN